MTDAGWKLRRLSAMGPAELVFRAWRATGKKIEQFRVSRGWAPTPEQRVEPGTPLFESVDGWLECWREKYSLDEDQLDALVRGEIIFFGYPSMKFGSPVSWHRDPLTGVTVPLEYGKSLDYRDDVRVGNVKIIWELGRHQHLVPLAVAYACGGRSRYRDAIADQIETWIDDNPFGLGIHWCSALEVALRLVSWAIVHSLLVLRDGGRGLFDVCRDNEKLGTAIYRQAWFVRHYLSRYSSANNHLIGELTGLFVACRVFDIGPMGSRWSMFAHRELETEAARQVYTDGVNKEQAIYYHLWVLEYLLFAWLVGERTGFRFSPVFPKRLRAMGEFLRVVTPAGGQPPQVGDADDGFVCRFEAGWPESPYESVLAALDYVQGIRKSCSTEDWFTQKVFWYGLISGHLPVEEKPASISDIDGPDYPIVFPMGGYAVLGGNGLHILFDAGPLGYPSIAAHGHADALSICCALDGYWWLVDPGTYAYHSDPEWRNYFRGTSAHNTLVVDDRDQSEMGGPFLWTRHAQATLTDSMADLAGVQYASGCHDGYKKLGVIHHRFIELSEEGRQLVIRDIVDGRGWHRLTMYFHFAPDVTVEAGPEEGEWIVKRPVSTRFINIRIDPRWQWSVYRGCESPRTGWYSPALGKIEPACTLVGVLEAEVPQEHFCRITIKE